MMMDVFCTICFFQVLDHEVKIFKTTFRKLELLVKLFPQPQNQPNITSKPVIHFKRLRHLRLKLRCERQKVKELLNAN